MTPRPTLPNDVRPSARAVALQVLLDCHRHDAFVQEVLERHFGRTSLSAADRRLVTQLACGVLRRRGTLDHLIAPRITRPKERVEPWLWEALRLGAYQRMMLGHIPPHAALNETVELAADFGRPGARGFLNGVLRALSRLTTDEYTATPAADALPLEDGRYRRLTEPVFPDPDEQELEYLASAFSLPPWLVERWATRYPAEERWRRGFWFLGPAPLWLRCNPCRVERPALLAALAAAGVAAEAGTHPQSVRLIEHVPIRELPGYADGWFSVQDESAMAVASALAPEPGRRVLDLCAAPGGKTTHLAELMQDRGQIIACDTDEGRLKSVAELAARLGLTIIQTQPLGPRGDDIPAGPFDAALVDVPCSNTGVLGRRPEVRWRLRPEEFRHLASLQGRLLSLVCARVRPGGVVVYSTCSNEPEENQEVVRRLLGEGSRWVLEAEEERSPGRPADGGYWARLRHSGEPGA